MTPKKDSRGRIKEPTQFKAGYSQSTALAFLSGKQFHQSGFSAKNRPGENMLHASALIENETFVPTPKPTPDIPVIDSEMTAGINPTVDTHNT